MQTLLNGARMDPTGFTKLLELFGVVLGGYGCQIDANSKFAPLR